MSYTGTYRTQTGRRFEAIDNVKVAADNLKNKIELFFESDMIGSKRYPNLEQKLKELKAEIEKIE